MALTKVSYSMIDSAAISVLDYGAVGDGVNNDAPAVQAAINAVNSAGKGTVVFPAGKTYFLNNQINLCNNLTLMGYGAKIIAGRGYATISTPLFKTFTGVSIASAGTQTANTNITILGLWVDGNDAGIPGVLVPNADMHGSIISIGDWSNGPVNNVKIKDCNFLNFEGNVIAVYESGNIEISGNYFENIFANVTLSTGTAIAFEAVNGGVISNNIITHTSSGLSWHGMVINDRTTGSKNITVSNNTIKNLNGGDGISCEGNASGPNNLDNCVFTGNVISNCAGDGIGVDRCFSVTITGNTIKDIGGIGIYLTVTETAVISGNNIVGCMSGIWSNGYSVRVIISGNRIEETAYLDANYQGEGIFIFNGSTTSMAAAEITGNYIRDLDGCGIYCNLTSSVVQGNTILDFGQSTSATRDFGIVARGTVSDNIVVSSSANSSYGVLVEDGVSVKNNRVSGTFTGGFYRVDFRNAIYSGSFISPNNLTYDDNTKKIVYWASSTPSATGTIWQVGDTIYNTAPTAGGTIGWVCTGQGDPGTWKTWGTIAS